MEQNVKINISSDNATFVCKVKDNGAGIPDENLNQIFEKFYRVPNTITGGTGLGLSIVKGFVEANKGSVTVENRKKGGARFIIRIPSMQHEIKNLSLENL